MSILLLLWALVVSNAAATVRIEPSFLLDRNISEFLASWQGLQAGRPIRLRHMSSATLVQVEYNPGEDYSYLRFMLHTDDIAAKVRVERNGCVAAAWSHEPRGSIALSVLLQMPDGKWTSVIAAIMLEVGATLLSKEELDCLGEEGLLTDRSLGCHADAAHCLWKMTAAERHQHLVTLANTPFGMSYGAMSAALSEMEQRLAAVELLDDAIQIHGPSRETLDKLRAMPGVGVTNGVDKHGCDVHTDPLCPPPPVVL